jgi:hypothetical protein
MANSSRWKYIHRTIGGILVLGVFLSGFDFSRHSIPLEEIQPGGPPKDGIPALLSPKFVPAGKAVFLKEEDRILALAAGSEAKAYPIRILNWHEVVNDTLGGKPILITYCPLCGTGMAFNPVINGRKYTFGVSGLLYNSDVLMYDHQTESLWSQIQSEAVTGPMTGTRLRPLFLIHTTWGEWRKEHPETMVLSTDTGYARDYSRDPYSGYIETGRILFPVKNESKKYHPKEWVLGVVIREKAKAYPFSELARSSPVFTDTINGETIQVHYNDRSKTAFITDRQGTPIPSVTGFWFAWFAFYPDTEVYRKK